MAVAIRTSSSISNDGGVASYTLTAPSGIVAGDFLLFIATADTDTNQAALVGPPSGSWTTTGGWYDASSSGGGVKIKTWFRWADGTDASKSWTVTANTGSANFAAIIALTGVDTTTPLAATPTGTGSNTTSTSVVAPAITPTVANAFTVLVFGNKGSASPGVTWTPPAGTTELIDKASGGTNYISTEVAYKQLTTAANVSTGTFTATQSVAKKWTAATVALNPAAAVVAYRRNLSTNPSFEVDTTGLGDWIGGGPFTRVSGGAISGSSWAARWGPQSGFAFSYVYLPPATSGSIVAGQTYTASVYVKCSRAISAGNYYPAIEWRDASGTALTTGGTSYGSTVAALAANTWTRLSVTAAAPAGAVNAAPAFAITSQLVAGDLIYADAVLYEQIDTLGTYFDGSSTGGTWEGTTGKSASYVGTPPNPTYQGAATLTSSSSVTIGAPQLDRPGAASLVSSSTVTALAWGTWRADLTQANSNLAGFENDSWNRETNAGTDSLSGLAWPILTEAAPGGRNGRALPFQLPAGGKRYEVVPKHADFGDKASGWFGMAFYLDAGFPLTGGNFQVIEQLRQASDTGSPVLALEARNGALHLSGGYGIDTASPSRLAYDQTLVSGLQTQRWYNVVYQVIGFSTSELTTVVNVWVDGVKVLDAFTIPGPTVVPDGSGGVTTYRKQGLYHDNTMPTASLHESGQKFGYSYAEVDPTATIAYAGAATLTSSSTVTANGVRVTTTSATLTSTSSTSANGYANIPIGGVTATAPSYLTATVTNRIALAFVTASTSSMTAAPSVPASAGPFVAASYLTAAVTNRIPVTLTMTSPSTVFAGAAVQSASGVTTLSASSTSASVWIEAFGDVEPMTATSSVDVTAFVEAVVGGDNPTPMTSSSILVADARLTEMVQLGMTSESYLTAVAVRTTFSDIRLEASSSVRATASGPEFLGARDSVLYATATLTTFGATTLTSSSSLTADAVDTGFAAATLTSSSSLAANLYAGLPVKATLTSSSSFTASSLPVISFGAALLVSQSSLVGTPIVQLPNSVFLFSTSNTIANATVVTPVFTAPAGPAKQQLWTPTMRLMVAETVSGRVGWELPFTDLSWSSELNKIGSMSATLIIEEAWDALNDQGAPDPRAALRGILSGPRKLSYVLTYGDQAVWAGPMQPSVDIAGTQQQVKVGASEIASILENRVLIGWASSVSENWAVADRDVVFQDTNPASAVYQIVQQAIDTSWNRPMRSLPIVSLEPPNPRGDELFQYSSYDLQTAWKAISDLTSRDDGPDVRFRPWLGWDDTGVSRVFYDLQIGDPYLTASGTPDDQGEAAWTWDDETTVVTRQNDGVDMTTFLWATGAGQDREKLIASARSDYLTDLGFPVLERVDSANTSETDAYKLGQRASGLMQAHELPTETWTVDAPVDGEPSLGNFWPGDLARLEVFKHALIEPGVYKRRITAVGGDSSSRVKITCAVENTEMAEA